MSSPESEEGRPWDDDLDGYEEEWQESVECDQHDAEGDQYEAEGDRYEVEGDQYDVEAETESKETNDQVSNGSSSGRSQSQEYSSRLLSRYRREALFGSSVGEDSFYDPPYENPIRQPSSFRRSVSEPRNEYHVPYVPRSVSAREVNVSEEPRNVPKEPRNVPEEPRNLENRGRDPVLSVFQEMLALMRQQTAANASPRAYESPSFLKIVTIMKNLGTEDFKGGPSTFEADQWLQNLEKNFGATRCQEDYKKDVAEYYLKNDASDWWTSVKRQYGHRNPTWMDFRREFEGKYFPPEARDRLEVQFVNLEQGEKSVRDYESEFTRLRKYVFRGQEDEAAMVRYFLNGLRAEIRNMLISVTYNTVNELVERAVNVERGLEVEKKAMHQSGDASKSANQKQSVSRNRSRSNQEGQSSKIRKSEVVCYSCGEPGHYFRECPSVGQNHPSVPPHIICYKCGERGHYQASCPIINVLQVLPAENHSPPARPEDEQPVKRQEREDRVYLSIDSLT